MTTRAIILRYADYRERSRMLTLLTEDGEKISASVHGSKAYAEPFVCAELTLSVSGGRKYVKEGRTVAEFRGLRADIEKFQLAAYIAGVVNALADSDAPQPDLFRLCARAFDTLSKLDVTIDGLLDAFQNEFERRAAELAGFISFDEIRDLLTQREYW